MMKNSSDNPENQLRESPRKKQDYFPSSESHSEALDNSKLELGEKNLRVQNASDSVFHSPKNVSKRNLRKSFVSDIKGDKIIDTQIKVKTDFNIDQRPKRPIKPVERLNL